MLTFADIKAAQVAIKPYVTRTPLVPTYSLGNEPRDVRLKLETTQPIGAFKLRGAINALSNLTPEQLKRGVVCASIGNHGRALAYGAKKMGGKATVCMSSLVPENKAAAIRQLGSDSPEKNELDPAILLKADYFVVDRVQQSIERGEMRSAINAGLMSVDQEVDEIGVICSGELKGRSSEDQITVCDLTGTGVQDTAIANFALTVAQRKKIGTSVNS